MLKKNPLIRSALAAGLACALAGGPWRRAGAIGAGAV